MPDYAPPRHGTLSTSGKVTETPHALRDFLWINFGFDLFDWAEGELRF